VVALEPIEGIRVLKLYGNHRTMVLSNTRPIYPPRVITGELDYPLMDQIEASVKALASKAWFIDATDEALKLGNPILGNIIMLGALSRVSAMPLEREGFEGVVSEMIPKDKLEVNLRAYDIGRELI
jgi:indolepyruvate ferredoxin oxidoreductase beta subunit